MPNIKNLLEWYDVNHRDLPWRNTSDPYKIWLSEVILQQTRVNQGMNYYLKFIQMFPTVHDLAAADEDAVLKLWQGLGYYSRARNLHQAAKMVVVDFDGVFPDNYESLKQLSGIGPYTAAAISSIVFNEVRPVVDGNVMRVVSRWFAIEEPVDSGKGRKQIEASLNELIDADQPGKFNQAMMEFGARYCKPQNPDCQSCIFKDKCLAFQYKLVHKLPVKKPKLGLRNRYFNYVFIQFVKNKKRYTLLRKRTEKDIWNGLYEFPKVESKFEVDLYEVLYNEGVKALFGNNEYKLISISNTITHQLTHQRIIARFINLIIDGMPDNTPDGLQLIPVEDIHRFPVSRLMHKYLEDSKL